MDKKKILFIGPLPPPTGGMGVSMQNIAGSHLKDKYDFIIFDITGKRSRHSSAGLAGRMFYQVSLMYKLVCILVKDRPAIVHVQIASYFYFYRRGLDVIVSRIFGRKIILHLRGAEFIDFYDKSLAPGKWVIRSVLNISDRIIALSRLWGDFLIRIADPGKVVVIPNGVVCSGAGLVNDKKKELGFGDRTRFVLFMGSIGKRKGVFDILDAIPQVIIRAKDVAFIFAGPEEDDGALEEFQRKIRDKAIDGHVLYVGTVSGQEKIDYYLSSDIYILPSYAENFPNAMLEAISAGMPMVVSGVGAVPEVIEDGVNGFIIKAGDVAGISEKVSELLKNELLRNSMREKNIKMAKERYDMPVVAAMIDEVYKGLIYG